MPDSDETVLHSRNVQDSACLATTTDSSPMCELLVRGSICYEAAGKDTIDCHGPDTLRQLGTLSAV